MKFKCSLKDYSIDIKGVSVDSHFCTGYISFGGKRTARKFSFTKYGEGEALRQAILWRRYKELEFLGTTGIDDELIFKNGVHEKMIEEILERIRYKEEIKRKQHQKELEKCKEKKKYDNDIAGKFIYRIDDPTHGRGWLVRIYTGDEVLCDVVFRDVAFSSKKQSLEAAKAERKKVLEKNNIPLAEDRKYSMVPRSTNKTGICGVALVEKRKYVAWIYEEPRKVKSCSFSINKYGEFEAFKKAVEWRRDKEIEVYGGSVLTDENLEKLFDEFYKN